MRTIPILMTLAVLQCLSACGLTVDSLTAGKEEGDEIYYFEAKAVPRAVCQPDDQPETGLQGQIPQSDRPPASNRALSPYYCNLREVGSFKGKAWATLDNYKDCAYYGISIGAGGTQTVYAPEASPVLPGAVLVTPAMQDPWESMKANNARGLLAAGGHLLGDPWLDVYDLSIDCRAPVLKASIPINGGQGHEGWWSPDGKTFWMTGLASPKFGGPGVVTAVTTMTAVDLTDPMLPVVASQYDASAAAIHGGSMSEDGNRAYVAAATAGTGMQIFDTSEIQARKPGAQAREISFTPIPENTQLQGVYKVTYKGHPYAIAYGEAAGRGGASYNGGECTFDRPEGPLLVNYAIPVILDIADEVHPKIVSRLILEVALPENCNKVAGDGGGFTYDTHHCTPDRLHDPTILACGNFMSGLRVFDIRDPLTPKELAYYNVSQPTGSQALLVNVGTVARPVIRTDRAEIWFVHDTTGFHVAKFAEGVWPFPETPMCSDASDWLFRQQNPTLECP